MSPQAFKFPPEVEQMMLQAGLCVGEADAPQTEPCDGSQECRCAKCVNEDGPVSQSKTKPAGSMYIPPPWLYLLRYAVTDKQEHGAALFGPRGTGKTSGVNQIAQEVLGSEWRQRVFKFQGAAGKTLDDLVGVRDLRDGRTIFTPGPLARAIAADGWLVGEEANMVHPGVWSEVNNLTDGSGDELVLIDGTRLAVGPNFRVILCFNEGAAYAGARGVNAALRDRLMPIYADYLPETQEADVLCDRTQVDRTTALTLAKFANAVRAARTQLGFDMSPRALMRLLGIKRSSGKTWDACFKATILDLMGDPVDQKPQRDVMLQIAGTAGISGWPEPKFGVQPPPAPHDAEQATFDEVCDCPDCAAARAGSEGANG